MNRISVFAIISFLAYAAILFIYRTMGYTVTTIFAQPSQFYFLIVPIVVILFVFQVVSIFLFRAKSSLEWTFKVAAYIFTVVVCLIAVLSPWIYIQAGSGLQLLLNMIVLITFVVLIAMHVAIKIKFAKRA